MDKPNHTSPVLPLKLSIGRHYVFLKSGNPVRLVKRRVGLYAGQELVEVARIDTGKGMLVPAHSLVEVRA